MNGVLLRHVCRSTVNRASAIASFGWMRAFSRANGRGNLPLPSLPDGWNDERRMRHMICGKDGHYDHSP